MRIGPIFALLLLTSCSSDKGLAASDQAVTTYHAEFNSGAFDQAYAESAPAMKEATPLASYVKFLGWVRSKLGSFHSGKRTSWTVNYSTGGTFTTLRYESQFDHGAATETFVFSNAGGKVRMVSVNVTSPLLIPG